MSDAHTVNAGFTNLHGGGVSAVSFLTPPGMQPQCFATFSFRFSASAWGQVQQAAWGCKAHAVQGLNVIQFYQPGQQDSHCGKEHLMLHAAHLCESQLVISM